MDFLNRLPYKHLYRAWGGLFALTAVLGLLFPGAQNPLGLYLLRLIAVVFFLPPWLVLAKARQEGSLFHIRLLRCLAIASLGMTLVLVCAGILAAPHSQALGDLIHVLMSVICAPLVCSNFYVLPMFLWATVLIGSFGWKK